MTDYSQGAQNAKTVMDAIADYSKVKAGTVTKATSETTAVVAHGFAATPDFILANGSANFGNILSVAVSADSTNITFTLNTAQATWSVSYIAGYTA